MKNYVRTLINNAGHRKQYNIWDKFVVLVNRFTKWLYKKKLILFNVSILCRYLLYWYKYCINRICVCKPMQPYYDSFSHKIRMVLRST